MNTYHTTAMRRYTYAADTFDWCVSRPTLAQRARLRRRAELMAYAMELLHDEVIAEERQWVKGQLRHAFDGMALSFGGDFTKNTLRK